MASRAIHPNQSADAERVLSEAMARIADLWGFSNAKLGSIIGLSGPTVSRMRSGAYQLEAGSKSFELAQHLLRLFRSLDPLVGSDAQKRHDWLRSHNKALNGTPAALIENPTGLVNALAYLDGMRAAA